MRRISLTSYEPHSAAYGSTDAPAELLAHVSQMVTTLHHALVPLPDGTPLGTHGRSRLAIRRTTPPNLGRRRRRHCRRHNAGNTRIIIRPTTTGCRTIRPGTAVVVPTAAARPAVPRHGSVPDVHEQLVVHRILRATHAKSVLACIYAQQLTSWFTHFPLLFTCHLAAGWAPEWLHLANDDMKTHDGLVNVC